MPVYQLKHATLKRYSQGFLFPSLLSQLHLSGRPKKTISRWQKWRQELRRERHRYSSFLRQTPSRPNGTLTRWTRTRETSTGCFFIQSLNATGCYHTVHSNRLRGEKRKKKIKIGIALMLSAKSGHFLRTS